MLRAVKVRLYPNKEQRQAISFQIGGARYVYNRTLALRKYAYQKFGVKVGKFALIKHITRLKKREKTSWLKDVDSQAIQQAVANMDKAYLHFFKGGGFPKFKSRHHHRQSYQYPQRVKIDGSRIYLPKVGGVRMKGWRKEFVGKIKTVTVSYEAYQYHASVLIELDDEIPLSCRNPQEAVGIDVGVVLMAADSDGNRIEPLDLTRELKKLRLKAQQLSRKKRGSSNRAKAKVKLAKINLKIANKRKDFLHKLSLRYAENQGIVVVEDLKIRNMAKSAKGTKEKPGKNVSAKAALNRKITQQGWGMFFEFLEYKLEERGGRLIKVDPKFTSQTCPACGHVSKNNRKSQSRFVCVSCGFSENADVVGAKNILARGINGNNASHQIAA